MKYHKHLLMACCEAINSIFFEDRYADKCIEYHFRNNKKWGGRDRRFFAETVYDCVRWWRLYCHLAEKKQDSPVDITFLAPSFWMRDLPKPEFEEFTKVDESRFQTRLNQLKNPAIRHSFPDWLFEKLADQPSLKSFDTMAPFFNKTNSVVLRVNTTKTSREKLIKTLSEEGVDVEILAGTDFGVILKKRSNVFQTQAFKNGLFEVQDGSSQQVAPYLDIQPGHRVIDACAGAGGKSLHIADILANKGKVISLDIHQWKLQQLKLRARRNTYSNIEMKLIESQKVIKRLHNSADRLLLDVPCTGLGVLRRNPDTKWKISENRLKELTEIQSQILNDYSRMLRPKGLMVYATCSVLDEENQQQVQKFIRENSAFSIVKQRHIFPTQDGFDGFYMALLRRET